MSEEVEVRIVGKNLKYYEDLGYIIPKYFNKKESKLCVKNGTSINVKIRDLPKQSHYEILVMCDYCSNTFKVRYDAYKKQRNNDVQSDCCNDCKGLKNKELNLLRYGVENQFQREYIKQKIENINIKKFGFYHPMKNKDIAKKAINTMCKNNNVETSRQQKYLHNLLGGKLNYNDSSTSSYALDMAYLENGIKFALCYDGGGHDLQVKFKNVTREEFNRKELIRYQILKKNGWKQIRIISRKDYIPADIKILEMIDYAKQYLNNNHSWIHFDIDNKKIVCSQFEKYYDFGKLRKIKEKDLEEVC